MPVHSSLPNSRARRQVGEREQRIRDRHRVELRLGDHAYETLIALSLKRNLSRSALAAIMLERQLAKYEPKG